MDHGKLYGGENKQKSIKSRFVSTNAQVPPGPLLDLIKDLVDVCAVCYEDPPPSEDQEAYELFLRAIARDPSLVSFATQYPFKRYQGRKKKLTARRTLDRFMGAANSGVWDTGPEGQQFETPLTWVDEVVIKVKRGSLMCSSRVKDSSRCETDGQTTLTWVRLLFTLLLVM